MNQDLNSPEGAPAAESWLASLSPQDRQSAAAALQDMPAELSATGPELPFLLAVWCRVDPAVAAKLLQQWISRAESGVLDPPCPWIAWLALQTARALPEPDPFVAQILPGLARVILANMDRYDPKGNGLPLWPSQEEALFPAGFVPGEFTVDLAVLLANEAEAFLRLAEGHAGVDAAAEQAEGEQRDLAGWLEESFWNGEESVFYRCREDGRMAPDGSASALMPLVWTGRTPEITEGIRPKAAAWDPAEWTPKAWILFYSLCLDTPHYAVMASMRRAGLPPGAAKTEEAAWTLLLAESRRRQAQELRPTPRSLCWMESRRRMLRRAGMAAGGILLVILLGWQLLHRERPDRTDLDGLDRRARQASAEGRHRQAAMLYGQAARLGRTSYFQYAQAGEWLREGDAARAESIYQELLRENPGSPNVRMNLACSLWHQGRLAEAREQYAGLEQESEVYPGLADRARLARNLIDRQMALDAP